MLWRKWWIGLGNKPLLTHTTAGMRVWWFLQIPDAVWVNFCGQVIARKTIGSQQYLHWPWTEPVDHSSSGSDQYFFNDFTVDCIVTIWWYGISICVNMYGLMLWASVMTTIIYPNWNYPCAAHAGPSTPVLTGNDYATLCMYVHYM